MHAALEAARCAGAAALPGFRGTVVAERKADGSPVTAWDRGAEQAAREWIAARFAADGIVGEELGALRPDAARRWIIDPIDGTKSFVRGVPLWGSLVAVVEGDRVLAGAAVFPALDEAIVAAPGEGCWWNGARCRVSFVSDLARATVLATDVRSAEAPERAAGWARVSAAAGVARTWGDAFGYLLVATGRAEAMADPRLAIWDAAPLVPIIAEAGGVFSDWDGGRGFAGGSAIATNRALADDVRRLCGAAAIVNAATARAAESR
ncbi:MAG: histidinol phosphate phosphatase [Candidatus Eisenbacteria bacterium]|nr:histidinol phosphate phosphatase [Candidatus Eisenbacteria bacterium]